MLGFLAHSAVDYTYSYNSLSSSSSVDSGTATIMLLVWLAVAVFLIVCAWRVYVKAGKPGWAAIVPFYNIWVWAEIGGKPGWWLFLYFIPFVNIVVTVLVALGVARNFGKGDAFGILLLWLLTPIGYIVLAFGKATYTAVASSVPTQPASPTPVAQ